MGNTRTDQQNLTCAARKWKPAAANSVAEAVAVAAVAAAAAAAAAKFPTAEAAEARLAAANQTTLCPQQQFESQTRLATHR